MMQEKRSAWENVYEVVRLIPSGRVATYGQISGLLDRKLSALAVGWALRACPADVPWHRVVNAAGRCSTDRLSHVPGGFQRALLENEGVEFGTDSEIDLTRFRWDPDV